MLYGTGLTLMKWLSISTPRPKALSSQRLFLGFVTLTVRLCGWTG